MSATLTLPNGRSAKGRHVRLAREGIREIAIGTLLLALLAWIATWQHWVLAGICLLIWIWLLSFFRDPVRTCRLEAGEHCAPADGTVTEVTHLDHHDDVGGPAIRVGIFLSLFDVHANRAPCDGQVVETRALPGRYLDARHPDSGTLNESNTLIMRVSSPYHGPIVVRQVAGLIARRIICHAAAGTQLARGQRFGMIKFGSRTELIVPDLPGTDITVSVGDKVRAGETRILRQPLAAGSTRDMQHDARGQLEQS